MRQDSLLRDVLDPAMGLFALARIQRARVIDAVGTAQQQEIGNPKQDEDQTQQDAFKNQPVLKDDPDGESDSEHIGDRGV